MRKWGGRQKGFISTVQIAKANTNSDRERSGIHEYKYGYKQYKKTVLNKNDVLYCWHKKQMTCTKIMFWEILLHDD